MFPERPAACNAVRAAIDTRSRLGVSRRSTHPSFPFFAGRNCTTIPTHSRRATARDFHFFATPSLWNTHPFLPLVRRGPEDDPELGVLFDARSHGLHGYDCTVFLTNLFLIPPTVAGLLALPRRVYDSWDELADDGWTVD
jgi:hypothetical protein